MPSLDPVLFDTGKALLTPAGLAAVRRAREALLSHPDAMLLMRAHTDTVASDAANAALARRRADTVRELLHGAGGVPLQRLYVAILPKWSLPQVTLDRAADEANRSVQLQLVRPAP